MTHAAKSLKLDCPKYDSFRTVFLRIRKICCNPKTMFETGFWTKGAIQNIAVFTGVKVGAWG
jgi:hypothetical protein